MNLNIRMEKEKMNDVQLKQKEKIRRQNYINDLREQINLKQ